MNITNTTLHKIDKHLNEILEISEYDKEIIRDLLIDADDQIIELQDERDNLENNVENLECEISDLERTVLKRTVKDEEGSIQDNTLYDQEKLCILNRFMDNFSLLELQKLENILSKRDKTKKLEYHYHV